MIARFLSVRFNYRLRCPVDKDKTEQTVKLQASPQIKGHYLDVVSCTAVPDIAKLKCGKLCRRALETQEYWRGPDLNSIIYSGDE